MKKHLLIYVTAIMSVFSSCSNDEKKSVVVPANPHGSVTFKLNGVQKTFTYFDFVVQNNGSENEYNFTAFAQPGSSTEYLNFRLTEAQKGAGTYFPIYYTLNSTHNSEWQIFSSNIVTNTNKALFVNFSGKIYITNGSNAVATPVTDGNINITYN